MTQSGHSAFAKDETAKPTNLVAMLNQGIILSIKWSLDRILCS